MSLTTSSRLRRRARHFSTQGDSYDRTGTLILVPPAMLPVDTNSLVINNTCTAHTYGN
jgi:hypothetical protein